MPITTFQSEGFQEISEKFFRISSYLSEPYLNILGSDNEELKVLALEACKETFKKSVQQGLVILDEAVILARGDQQQIDAALERFARGVMIAVDVYNDAKKVLGL